MHQGQGPGASTSVSTRAVYIPDNRDDDADVDVGRSKALQWLLRVNDYWLGPWPAGRYCQQVLRSLRSIRTEQRRQRTINRCIIHPFSRFRLIWSVLMIIMNLISTFALPIDLAFFTAPVINEDQRHPQPLEIQHPEVYAINLATDIAYLADIVLQFRTAYLDHATDQVVMSNVRIVKHYLTTWFIVDLIAVCPYDEIYESTQNYNRVDNLGILVCRFLKVLCILRIIRLLRYINEMQMYFTLHAAVMRLINLVMITIIYLHWNGCLQYMICYCYYYPEFPDSSWISIDELVTPHLQDGEASVRRKYTRSLFRAVSHLNSVNYGKGPPLSLLDTWTVNISMLLSCTLHAVFLAIIVETMATIDSAGKGYDDVMNELRQFLRFHHVPRRLQKRCILFFEQKYRHAFFDEHKILHTTLLSPPRREEIALSNCRTLLESIEMFKSAPADMLSEVLLRLEFQVYFRGDYVVRAGRRNVSLFFISSGRVEYRTTDTSELQYVLVEGDFFGVSWLINGELSRSDVIAADMCDIFALSANDYREITVLFPDFTSLLKSALRAGAH